MILLIIIPLLYDQRDNHNTHTYFYSCVKNGCVDYLRKLKITDPLDVKLFDAAYYTGDFDMLEQEKLICRVEEEIEELPEGLEQRRLGK